MMAAKPRRGTGRVLLVGAGPGDPELMTIKAHKALQSADVVLHDDLVNPEILGMARTGARLIAVGKRGGCRSTPQAFIVKLAEAEAAKGNVVVRLKGGDPMLFGRGGEELQALRAAGVSVEVINGISSGVAAATEIGVPLTHRGMAAGVAFVTGHSADGSDQRWVELGKTGLTLVIYMGVARAADIRDGLLAGGMRDSMPVAVIHNATLPSMRSLRTMLSDFPEAMSAAGLGSPAIIVVGAVVDVSSFVDLAPTAPARLQPTFTDLRRPAYRRVPKSRRVQGTKALRIA